MRRRDVDLLEVVGGVSPGLVARSRGHDVVHLKALISAWRRRLLLLWKGWRMTRRRLARPFHVGDKVLFVVAPPPLAVTST